ncbi:MAG: hypothetical protein ACYCVD_04215 [Desulfitobacteriaceae bacterium]
MPIVTSMQGQVLDNVYTIETKSPPNIQGLQVGIVKMAGTFNKGILGAVYTINDYASAVRLLGPSTAGVDGPINLQALINQKCGGIQVVPVFGTTAASASVTIQDTVTPTAGNDLVLTAAQVHPQTGVMTVIKGTDANNMVATIANSSGTTFDLTIQYGNVVETYKALTLANMVATINATSKIAIASLPGTPSAVLPKVGTFSFTGGTNGTPADADFVGAIDGSGNRTGLKSLEPIVGNLVFVANQNSTTINAAVAAHATSFNCIGLVCTAISSTVTATTAANTYLQDNVAFLDGWRTMNDADTVTVRNIAPMALVAGMVSQKAVYKSWGNKSIAGTIASVTPRNDSDLATLQQDGVLCVADNIPRGGVGTRSGVASDGSDLVTRQMRYFLELSIQTAIGWAVGEMQSTDPKDPLRKKIKGSIDAFLSPMANPIDINQKSIDSFLTICDLSNNPLDQIALGKLSVNTKVKLLATAKQIIVNADISQGTITTSSQAA